MTVPKSDSPFFFNGTQYRPTNSQDAYDSLQRAAKVTRFPSQPNQALGKLVRMSITNQIFEKNKGEESPDSERGISSFNASSFQKMKTTFQKQGLAAFKPVISRPSPRMLPCAGVVLLKDYLLKKSDE